MAYRDYPELTSCKKILDTIVMYVLQKHEFGADRIPLAISRLEQALQMTLDEIKQLPVDETQKRLEPDALEHIRLLRPNGPRRLWRTFDKDLYLEKLEGALLARMAGCTLGAVVGKQNVPLHWYRNFNNTIHTYIKDHRYFQIDDVVARYARQAEAAFSRFADG